ncbi:poly polymerase (Poly synthetase) [Penicillium riverlandense]|uniref:poly polymerase (Poly synthetase) n=1 Tax=Penicillium riverlandense TaxID=1903569 RepID=UPI002548B048|nr:poly polymerase (Poly synthetase) [Penicillium riverlandense]KAJ5833700.1 poly polymerase (Poly synthetase) [Penicillium riverlandense]
MNPKPLSGLVIAASGNLSGIRHHQVKQVVEEQGARFAYLVTHQCTHLVTTQRDVDCQTWKVRRARALQSCAVVSLRWLTESLKKKTPLSTQTFLLKESNFCELAFPVTQGEDTPTQSRKRRLDADSEGGTRPSKKIKITRIKKLCMPIDVRREWLDMGATLADLNPSALPNAANLTRFQILFDVKAKTYQTWFSLSNGGYPHEGRVLETSTSLEAAKKQFLATFKKESGHSWGNRNAVPKIGHKMFIARTYDDEGDILDLTTDKAVKCTLTGSVKEVMEFIFDKHNFNISKQVWKTRAGRTSGELSEHSLRIAIAIQKRLRDLVRPGMSDPEKAALKNPKTPWHTVRLSKLYSIIVNPSSVGGTFVLYEDSEDIENELRVLSTLLDMKVSIEMMSRLGPDTTVHNLDRVVSKLNLKELAPVSKDTVEFRAISDYLHLSIGTTHRYKYALLGIVRLERPGEAEKLAKSAGNRASNRMLLWHGSTCAGLVGILNRGLQVRPFVKTGGRPCMFGEGIYFADMSSKSIGYCDHQGLGNKALLLLCEVEMGPNTIANTSANYKAKEQATANNHISAIGAGKNYLRCWHDAMYVHPSLRGVSMPDVHKGYLRRHNPKLLYNEYVVWNPDQVRIRYLVHLTAERA